jgi:predicted dienelactone hydrolase
VRRLRYVVAAFVALAATSACAVGFQHLSIPNGTAAPITIGVWYPSDAQPAPATAVHFGNPVALDGAVKGRRLPLVVISHGSRGWYGGHQDTAQALAEAGFVVAAPTHPGDNVQEVDEKSLQIFIHRPQEIGRVIDYMTQSWRDRDHIDPARIGFFGFSAGGFTGLVAIGGVPDWKLVAPHCAQDPLEGVCKQRIAPILSRPDVVAMPASSWQHDSRIKAAVLAAPGFSFSFDPGSMRGINMPLQLWGGADDRIIPFATNIGYLQRFLPQKPEVHEVAGAGHYAFLLCNPYMRANLAELCTDQSGFDRDAFHRTFNHSLTIFFRRHLMGR